MPKFSIEKMQEIRKSNGYTYKKLAELTGISESTITKLFGGFNKNPTLSYLRKIADALNCSLDDFYEWESEPTSPYYIDRKTAELAQELHDNPDYRILFDAMRDMTPEQVRAIITVANSIKGTSNG
ncbi:putative uncharacterized protein [Clostridium sp. CAG:768]|nr:putative uncharacterized protein [Clostridium sp. CAG:768]